MNNNLPQNDLTFEKTQEGKENQEYTHSKLDKDGYKLVNVTSESEPKAIFDAQGNEVHGNFVAEKELSVTYKYVKTKTETKPELKKGSFVVNHFYYDSEELYKAGSKNEKLSTSTRTEGGTDDTFKHSKIEKEGYKLVKITSSSEPKVKFNEDGSEVIGNYIPNKELEVTYIYIKEKRNTDIVPKNPKNHNKSYKTNNGDNGSKNITSENVVTNNNNTLPKTGVSGILVVSIVALISLIGIYTYRRISK